MRNTLPELVALVGLVALLAPAVALAAPPESPAYEPLWPKGAPGALGTAEEDTPAMAFYLADPAKAVGTAVIVFPGGGYGMLANDHEGAQVARWLNTLGVTAFVVRYRLGPKYHHPVELGDAQRAIRTVRSRAAEIGVRPDRIGILGFSAGGHLASTAGTHFDDGDPKASDPVDRAGSRPDFLVLCYPVVTLKPPYAHVGSRENLLGKDPDPKLVDDLSNDERVTARTPPTFLWSTVDDDAVPVQNSVQFFLALRKAGVPAEAHFYEHGPHGVGLAPNDPALSGWPARLADWMRGRGLLAKAA